MIKSWLKFNESSSDDIRSQLSSKLTEVRDIFLEFEDMGIISYTFERGYSFDPNRGDFERFLDYATLIVNNMRSNNMKNKYKVSEKDFCIIVDIKLPGEPTEFGSTVLGNEGIKIFEDILVANSRLIDTGYDVKLDMNAGHNAYKPIKLLIYFNL